MPVASSSNVSKILYTRQGCFITGEDVELCRFGSVSGRTKNSDQIANLRRQRPARCRSGVFVQCEVYDNLAFRNVDAPYRVNTRGYCPFRGPYDLAAVIQPRPERVADASRLEDQSTMKLVVTVVALKVFAMENDSAEGGRDIVDGHHMQKAKIIGKSRFGIISHPIDVQFFAGGNEAYRTDERMFQAVQTARIISFGSEFESIVDGLKCSFTKGRFQILQRSTLAHNHVVTC